MWQEKIKKEWKVCFLVSQQRKTAIFISNNTSLKFDSFEKKKKTDITPEAMLDRCQTHMIERPGEYSAM